MPVRRHVGKNGYSCLSPVLCSWGSVWLAPCVSASCTTCGTWPPSNLSGLTLNKDSTATKKVGTNTTARGVAANMPPNTAKPKAFRSEEHTSELQSLMSISYDVFCLKNNKKQRNRQI